MSSKEIMDGLNFVKQILIKPYYDENTEGKRLKYVIEMKDSFLQGSLIVKADEADLIKEWMGKCYIVTELLFRASKDGFSASNFHTKCNDKGANIVLIRSKNTNQVFGGCITKSWQSNSNYEADAAAFLFHVTKKTKIEQFANPSNALYHYSSYMSTWGGGHDLMICDNCDKTNSSYTNLGYTYKCPNGIAYSSEEAKNYFAGGYNFLVDELEVYKVVVQE